MDSDDEFMSGLSSQDDVLQDDSDDGSLGDGKCYLQVSCSFATFVPDG